MSNTSVQVRQLSALIGSAGRLACPARCAHSAPPALLLAVHPVNALA